MAWSPFQDAQPWLVLTDEIDFFSVIVPGDWTADVLKGILEQPSTAGFWQVQSIHPGSSSGPLAKAYEVLAYWMGPPASISNTADLTFVGRYVWSGGQPPSSLPAEPTPWGQILGSAALGLALGFGAGWLFQK